MRKYEEKVYEKPDAYSRYMALSGKKVATPATEPSLYISLIKLRKGLKSLTDKEIGELFFRRLGVPGVMEKRKQLNKKLNILLGWQILKALKLLLKEGNTIAARFIRDARSTDVQPPIKYTKKDERRDFLIFQRPDEAA
jgi:hypothetical protein